MPRPITFLPFLLDSFLLTPLALIIRPLDTLTQLNHPAAPILSTNPHDSDSNLTAPEPPVCWFLTKGPPPSLSDLKCSFLAEELCSELDSQGPKARKKWIWSEISGCALGYYLPIAARVPRKWECEYGIFEQIREKCATDPQYNAGSINVFDLPDFSSDGTGQDLGSGRFMMAPERLTL